MERLADRAREILDLLARPASLPQLPVPSEPVPPAEALSNTTVHVDQLTPRSAQHRYVTEEIPYGLVPISEIASMLGIPTPNIDAIIALASTVNDEDYRATGRHLSSLGLGRMTPEELLATL